MRIDGSSANHGQGKGRNLAKQKAKVRRDPKPLVVWSQVAHWGLGNFDIEAASSVNLTYETTLPASLRAVSVEYEALPVVATLLRRSFRKILQRRSYSALKINTFAISRRA
eukprot:6186506-Pleurochrysis_carterae.AAC.1